jgi:hypothetical protein
MCQDNKNTLFVSLLAFTLGDLPATSVMCKNERKEKSNMSTSEVWPTEKNALPFVVLLAFARLQTIPPRKAEELLSYCSSPDLTHKRSQLLVTLI